MTLNYGSKAPSQYALDQILAARDSRTASSDPKPRSAAGGTAGSVVAPPATTISTPAPVANNSEAAISLDAGIANQWPVRDQYGRGTCVAFATLAAVELHRALHADMLPERLSEQFLHERMMTMHRLDAGEDTNIPDGGVLLHQAFRALSQNGVVGSENAPYKPTIEGLGRPQGPAPSPEAINAGLGQRIYSRAYGTIGTPEGMDPDLVDSFEPGQQVAEKMLDFLRDGLPVAVGVPLFQHPSGLNNWILPSTIRTGVVLCPEDADAPQLLGPRADGHVVCLTGFEPDHTEPFGGWFVFRNSWGLEFASHAASGSAEPTARKRGYGLISATHINSYCWEYLVPVAQEPAV